MMAFLATVTLIYAIVLVLVLAVSLITILYYLWSIGTTLGKIRGGLELVRDQTAPLSGQLGAINGALASVAAGFSGALDDFAATDAALAGLIGEDSPTGRVA
ncbi:MAG: RDD family protein [Chloroflexi bacterium]|nr:RDD family protein [Chloroflexota bacterium]